MWKWAALVMCAAACGREGSKQERGMRDTGQANEESTAPASRGRDEGARKTIVFLGTSLTAGYGIDLQQAYPALIQRRIDSLGLSYDVVNAGVSGETSSGAVHRIDWLLRQPMDVFVLETGANDGLRGLPVNALRSNIQRILEEVKRTHPRAKILLVGMEAPPNMGRQYTTAFRQTYIDLSRKYDVTLLPFLLKGVGGVDTLNQADMIHPNPRGAAILAETVWRALRPLLESKDIPRA